MGFTICQVDTFTDRPFAGNLAAVCVLSEPREEQWMHNVAREMNLSETAFLSKQADDFSLRWFTPVVEVDLCGHATLASAHILWETGHLKHDEPALFHTRSGLLKASRGGDWIELDFPAQPDEPTKPAAALVRSLDVNPKYTGKNQLYYVVEVDSEETVRNMKPDFAQLGATPIDGVTVTAPAATPGYDFVSRFFAPGFGINEDPVTGSSYCLLGSFWQKRLNKNESIAYQASARGGVVKVRVSGDRVFIWASSPVLRGELVLALQLWLLLPDGIIWTRLSCNA